MTNLRDTVNLMSSEDYKERFIAEYWQTKIRYEKLKAFNTKIVAEEKLRYSKPYFDAVMTTYSCPPDVLREQQSVMGNYLHILELRAVIEGIDLNAPMKCCEGSAAE